MSIVSRRTFTHGLLASALVPGNLAIGQPNDPASIAIIDTPHNAAKVASKLAAQNVKVVVRFFARKPQPGLREKIMASDGNMIDGVREPTILIRNGLSIVSLYQYRNNLPEKFLKGLEDTGSAKAEAAADAKAALDQARLVGQPEGSAIYFGVDFNVNRASVDSVLEYFRVIGQTVGSRYAIGSLRERVRQPDPPPGKTRGLQLDKRIAVTRTNRRFLQQRTMASFSEPG